MISIQKEEITNELKASIFDIGTKIQEAQFDVQKWKEISHEAEALPSVYPVSRIKNALLEVNTIADELNTIQQISEHLLDEKLKTETFFELFSSLERIDASLETIEENTNSIPDFLLPQNIIDQREYFLRSLKVVRLWLEDVQKFERIFQTLSKDQARILILLQNQNEPRPTGGFVGSMILVDFTPEEIQWKFSDVYALDREIPLEAQIPAPQFFHDLSQTISLRDANFWLDFKESSNHYRSFFESIDEKVPNTVLAINMNVIREILHLTGPITLQKWNVKLDEYNFDLVLQFLVEAKVSGRFDTKQPVMIFAEELGSSKNFQNVHASELLNLDWQKFITEKNILAHSQNSNLQKLFEKWGIDGQLRQKNEADNFVALDFISVGANKSEKFVWTKLWHDSEVYADGTVKNSLDITRTHALASGEISRLLGENTWSQNLKDLLTEEILWKLGAGQNRTILRAYIPKESKILDYQNPSGELGGDISPDKNFRILEIPLFVGPGETIHARVEYETKIHRGSVGWRPYFLQLSGTPGRDKTSFLSTISTDVKGKFRAETQNIGRPQNLIDSDFRAVVEFQQEK